MPRTPRRSPAWWLPARSSRCCREEVIKALRVALETVLDEEAAQNEQFKKILANWRQFRADQHRWFSIADTRAELAVYRTDSK